MSQVRQRGRVHRREAQEQIRAAAVEMLRTQRFRDVSLEALMARTGLARTAFYRHYDDLADLILQVLGTVGTELYDVVERWVHDGEDDFEAAMRRGLREIVAFFQKNGPLVRAVIDAAAADELVEKAYDDFVATYEQLIVGGFDGLVERGRLPACDTRALARALNLMGERYLVASFGSEPTADPDVAVATMETIWMRTIGQYAAGPGTAGGPPGQ